MAHFAGGARVSRAFRDLGFHRLVKFWGNTGDRYWKLATDFFNHTQSVTVVTDFTAHPMRQYSF